MRVGDLVTPNDSISSPKMFRDSWAKTKVLIRPEVGKFKGFGIVIEIVGDDVLIFSNGVTGWCFLGNVRVVS